MFKLLTNAEVAMMPSIVRFVHHYNSDANLFETTSPDMVNLRITASSVDQLKKELFESVYRIYSEHAEGELFLSSMTFTTAVENRTTITDLLSMWIEEDKSVQTSDFEKDVEEFNANRMSALF